MSFRVAGCKAYRRQVVSSQYNSLSCSEAAAMQVSRESNNAYLASASEGIRLQQAVQTRSLIQRQGESAFHFVRIFKVLEVVHELLRCLLCNCKLVFVSLVVMV